MNGTYDFNEASTPSLTLEPELESVAELTAPQEQKQQVAEPVLTDEEKRIVAEFAASAPALERDMTRNGNTITLQKYGYTVLIKK